MDSTYRTRSNEKITLGDKLGSGGEGDIWRLQGRPEVAKIYHPGLADRGREQKLTAMVANPPRDEMLARYNHVSIAWPNELVFNNTGFAGFLMPRLGESFTILEIYNPVLRRMKCPGFNWKYRMHTALNLSKALAALHEKSYVMGDINEGNILVNSRALVSLIDTDSYQVTDSNGRVFRCTVGKEEFTPHELHGIPFDKVDRKPEHDYFGLAVLIFLLLMEGNHPYSGVLKASAPIDMPSNVYCLRQGAFPYARNPLAAPRPTAPRFDILPPEIQRLMKGCFVHGYRDPGKRPSAEEWASVLELEEGKLAQCRKDENHFYAAHLKQCPWCNRQANLQTPLPPAKRKSKPATRTNNPQKKSTPQVIATVPQPAPAPKPSSPSPAAAAIQRARLPVVKSFQKPAFLSNPWLVLRKKFRLKRRSYSLPRTAWLRPSIPSGRPTLRSYWLLAWPFLLLGSASGLGLFFLAQGIFRYPQVSQAAAGVLNGAILALPLLFVARYFFRLSASARRFLGVGLVLLWAYLTVTIGLKAYEFAGQALAAYSLHLPWLLFDCLLIGLLEGAIWGAYRLFRPRYRRLSAIAGVMLIVIVPLLMAFSGLLDLAFPLQ